MQFNIFFKRLKSLLPFVFPLLLIISITAIVFVQHGSSVFFSFLLPVILVVNVLQCVWLLFKGNKKVLFNFTALVVFFYYFDSFVQVNFSEEDVVNTFSVLTYNVQGYQSKSVGVENSKTEIADFIKGVTPDIFFIQEFSAIEYKRYQNEYPYWLKSNTDVPYKSVLGVFSKFPILKNGYIKFYDSYNNSMFVDVEINDRVIRVYNLHLESFKLDVRNDIGNLSSSYKYLLPRFVYAEEKRIAQANVVRNHINNFDGDVIVLGDFNSTQYSSVYRILKGDRDDTFVAQGSGFGSTFKLLNYPFKVDHILVDPSFEVVKHENFNLQLSDHEPVLAELKFKD